MSVFSAQSSLRQVENDIKREEKKKSDAESKIARLSKQISDKEAEISKTTSASSRQSKQNQIRSWTSDLNRARNDAADTGVKLAKLYEKRRKAEQTLREEQQKESDKGTKRMQRTIDELTERLESRTAVREPNMIMQCVRPLIERYSDALPLFDSAAENYEQGNGDRNALDDIRLCFEKVLQALFSNDKSLENQMPVIGGLLKGADVSAEFRNLLNKAIDYYSKYQNNHVKHDDTINPHEVSFVIEFTCILMKQMIEQFGQGNDNLDDEADEIDDTNPDQAEIDRLLN
jgi:hypothetical protein